MENNFLVLRPKTPFLVIGTKNEDNKMGKCQNDAYKTNLEKLKISKTSLLELETKTRPPNIAQMEMKENNAPKIEIDQDSNKLSKSGGVN
jgi:hypothetical protein